MYLGNSGNWKEASKPVIFSLFDLKSHPKGAKIVKAHPLFLNTVKVHCTANGGIHIWPSWPSFISMSHLQTIHDTPMHHGTVVESHWSNHERKAVNLWRLKIHFILLWRSTEDCSKSCSHFKIVCVPANSAVVFFFKKVVPVSSMSQPRKSAICT